MASLLTIYDYIVFGVMLAISALIGLYYQFTGGRQRTTKEYLLGDGDMGIFPVAISLMASFMSAITLLGVPAENYFFSTQFLVINISYIIGTPIAAFIFMPVFFQMKATSAYQYLEHRFDIYVRTAASSIFIIQMILYMGIVLYAPALALSAVTGLSKWWSIISVGLVCTLYCTTGGMKAVLWTDVFQSFLMFASMIIVVVKGTMDVGGAHVVWQRAIDGNRIQFLNFDIDPTTRHTVWSLAIGGVFIYVSLYGINQTQVQRCLSVKSLKKAQFALFISWPTTTLLSILASSCGIVLYAYFYHCDPLLNGDITSKDQLLPYFVMQSLNMVPGLPGLFIAGIFSGALSTVSSFVNSLSAVTLEDYVKVYFFKRKQITEEKAVIISKCLACMYGLICLLVTYLAEQMTGILQASLTIFGVVGGPLLALYTLGMCTKFCTPRGALVSFIVSLIFGFVMGFGALFAGVKPQELPLTIEQCANVNATLALATKPRLTL
ncbi:putative sodium-dependent multivitamin transporter-like protein [Leptotrombidium deliense]|uniref:Putative sodium-dependent multivitamin transporter-like protein n=1 Tax=Leptotrombidium deliense TaxID=299467 RepID=A0A443S7N9_9ACAR|nr:putative sodium-dependent multivitamin transporter-like protein [Leptotrombidium deliense]